MSHIWATREFFLIISPASTSSPSPVSPFIQHRHSPWATPGKILLPLLPLDIKIGASQPRGKRPAAHIDEAPDEDQSGNTELGPRRSVRRRVRFQSPTPKRRVGDDPEVTDAAPYELWVAVGEVGPINNLIFLQTLTILAGQV